MGMTKGDEEYLATGKHKISECSGEVVTTTDGYKICRHNTATCPVGWYQFYNWSKTIPVTSGGYPTCTTPYHDWDNEITEICLKCDVYGCWGATAIITQIGCI
jgi:hypothetical protein